MCACTAVRSGLLLSSSLPKTNLSDAGEEHEQRRCWHSPWMSERVTSKHRHFAAGRRPRRWSVPPKRFSPTSRMQHRALAGCSHKVPWVAAPVAAVAGRSAPWTNSQSTSLGFWSQQNRLPVIANANNGCSKKAAPIIAARHCQLTALSLKLFQKRVEAFS
ncbi:hypothetical protein VPH35_060624 [Triticum aestivum]